MFPYFGAIGKTPGKRLVKHLGHFAAICGDLRFISFFHQPLTPPITKALLSIFRITPNISTVELEGVVRGNGSRLCLCVVAMGALTFVYLFG